MDTSTMGPISNAPIQADEPLAGSISAPDWEALKEEVRCPMCEYNLRGLTEPRCPECGYTFRWEEMLDRRRRHEYLFEHHPEKNLKSFVRTVIGGLFPWSFWSSLHPAQRPNLRRLLIYRSILTAFAWLPLVTAILTLLASELMKRPSSYGSYIGYELNLGFSSKATFVSVLVDPLLGRSVSSFMLLMTLFLLALPSLTALPLSIFQATMRQAKVEHHHIRRCITYSFDVVVWPALWILAISITMFFLSPRLSRVCAFAALWSILLMGPVVWLLMAIRLAFACSLYLRLRHAVAVVLASEVIVFLLVVFLLGFVVNILT